MPVLLKPEQAIALPKLILQANAVGLEYTFISPESTNNLLIQGLGALSSAGATEISFLSNPRLRQELLTTKAAAVIIEPKVWQQIEASGESANMHFEVVLCSSPYALYAMLAQWFDQHRINMLPTGIHPSAWVDPAAILSDGVSVGPFAVIEAGAKIGHGTRIGAHCIIGSNTSIGSNCILHSSVTIYHDIAIGNRTILHSGSVIGADGFGFAPDPSSKTQAWVKIAQLGSVHIGDDVEIGANTTVDRGALENTYIGNGVKLDNLIMIAHNVVVGDHTAMAGCVGIAGSSKIGARCTIGGASMVSGHLVIGDDTHVSGGTGITSNIDKPGHYTGVFPYSSHKDWQKNAAALLQLAELRQRLRKIERNN